jgi:very-short-patch-repair endonuclease
MDQSPEEPQGLETISEYFERLQPQFERTHEMLAVKSYYESLKVIAKYYEKVNDKILKLCEKDITLFYHTYPFDWNMIFTPIEALAWQSIRMKGRVVLYPQYPVLNYHIDFANPGLKIALELDGKNWHDPEKDLLRDNELRSLGWKVYRVTGREMYNENYKNWMTLDDEGIYDEYEMLEHLANWILNTGDGVIHAIRVIHFMKDHSWYEEREIRREFFDLCKKTLREHQLTEETIRRYN